MENWYETEGSIRRLRRSVSIGQKDRKPLDKICGALRRGLGIERCTMCASSSGYNVQLPLEESAKFVKYSKPRVKTRKARKDLLELERRILEPSKVTRAQRRKAREILLSQASILNIP